MDFLTNVKKSLSLIDFSIFYREFSPNLPRWIDWRFIMTLIKHWEYYS